MKLPRKKMFPLRLLCCTGVVILYKCCSDAFVVLHTVTGSGTEQHGPEIAFKAEANGQQR